VAFTFFGVFLAGCLDAPDYPKALQPVDYIEIMVKQKDDFSTTLKVYPSDSACIKAKVYPQKYQNDLAYEWYYSNEGKDSLLTRNPEYSFYPNKSRTSIPNKLIVIDEEGNQNTFDFTIIINSPPVLSDSTIPVNKDTIYATKNSAILFEWYSFDMDLSNGDTLFHILEIDGMQYDVGTITQVKQAGLESGSHSYRIIVYDLYGDADTLSNKTFFLVDTLEAK
jgi:hypothetical protein